MFKPKKLTFLVRSSSYSETSYALLDITFKDGIF